MRPFAILSNDGCAFDASLRQRFGVDKIFLGNITYPDGHSEKADPEYARMSPEAYFGSMNKKGGMFKTAAANIDEIEAAMEELATAGKDILCIVISAALSGTYNFSLKAAERVKEKHPECEIVVIDSRRYSTALGLLLVEASELRAQGKTLQETAAWIEENKSCFHQIGIMDDLFFLARAGRISKAKAFMGNLVGVEPMADFAANGLSEVIGKGKGKRKSLLAAAEYVKQTIVEPEKHVLFVCHSLRPQEAEFLKEAILKLVQPKDVIISIVDQTSGANMGPGLAAAFYYGKPLSEGLTEEKALLANILGQK